MRVLVTGGAGFIGSHVVKLLCDRGHDVAVVDDLSTGHRDTVDMRSVFWSIDICSELRELKIACGDFQPDVVMHFASLALVGESMRQPTRYFRDNVLGAANLLEAMVDHGRNPPIIFSSSCATYGNPQLSVGGAFPYVPFTERDQQNPVNPYGQSKLAVEQMLYASFAAHNVRSLMLRYFNAAGAAPEWGLGERHDPETHLIPLLLQVAAGKHPAAVIYGNDYDTPDGTCIRDYIHVLDIADAHVRALDHLMAGRAGQAINLGTGKGHSVLEVLRVAREVTGHPIPAVVNKRRPGDPPVLVADSRRALEVLDWKATRGLNEMVDSAWRFMRGNVEP